MSNYYYVYYLIDPNNMQPFYVGKGSKNRMYQHFRIRNTIDNIYLKEKLCYLAARGQKPIYEKVIINIPEKLAYQKEIELIKLHGRLIDKSGILCNICEGGNGCTGSSWSESRRKETSDRMKGARGYLPIMMRPVSQYTLTGDHIKDFPSAKVASESVKGANRSYITQVCKGKRKSAGGFIWTYKGNPVPEFSKKYYRAVNQYSLDGNLLATFQSLTEAQNQTGVELHNISEACRGNSKTAGGFIWNYYTP